MARKRSGTLELRKSGWFARITVDVGCKSERRWFPLGSFDKEKARRVLAKLVRELDAGRLVAEANETAHAADTVADLAWPWNERREADGVVMAHDEATHLREYILPELGSHRPEQIRRAQCQAVITQAARKTIGEGAKQRRLSYEYLKKIRGTMSRLFKELRRLELIDFDPVELVEIPKGAPRALPPEQLRDDEAAIVLADPRVDPELKLLAIVARVEAGMRTGELNKWDWSNIREDFTACDIFRSKTNEWQHGIEIPELLRPWLRAWWLDHGRPRTGPVFPARRGKNKGQFKSAGGVSYAKRLRVAVVAALGRAHVTVRPELLTGRPGQSKRLNFHSFRHAFNSALARAGVNVQTAMALANHADAKTHMRYVEPSPEMKRIPLAALPLLMPTNPSESSGAVDDSMGPTVANSSTPGVIRTRDQRLRRPPLYPSELRALVRPC